MTQEKNGLIQEIDGGIAVSGALAALASLINGKRTRDMQRKLHAEDAATADRRFQATHGLEVDKLIFNQEEAERNRAERAEGLILRARERAEDQKFTLHTHHLSHAHSTLSAVFQGSIEGWLHDPYARPGSSLKSLRLFFQRPKGFIEDFHTIIERKISDALKLYDATGGDYPVHFRTGVWREGAQSGSWMAGELHAIDQRTPTLIFRLEKFGDQFMVQADMFGFRLGERSFVENIDFSAVGDDPKKIAEVLPLMVLASADTYYVYTYGKRPLLPELLPKLLPAGDKTLSPATEKIVENYRAMVNALTFESPEIGLYAALNLANSLCALPDKRFALEQTMQIEEMMRPRLSVLPDLRDGLYHLYTKLGDTVRANRILECRQTSPAILTFDASRRL